MSAEPTLLTDAGVADDVWHLCLYVAGQSPRSLRAYTNLKAMCEEHLNGRYTIELVDLLENPSLARTDDVLAIPTLVRRLPAPLRKIIGDLSNTEKVLIGLRVVETRVSEEHHSTLETFEGALADTEQVRFELTLFVSGASDLAARAIANARHLCDAELDGNAGLIVVDVHGNPAALLASGVLATPTLVRNWPLPVRTVVGDLSHTDRVLLALELLTESPKKRSVAGDAPQISA